MRRHVLMVVLGWLVAGWCGGQTPSAAADDEPAASAPFRVASEGPMPIGGGAEATEPGTGGAWVDVERRPPLGEESFAPEVIAPLAAAPSDARRAEEWIPALGWPKWMERENLAKTFEHARARLGPALLSGGGVALSGYLLGLAWNARRRLRTWSSAWFHWAIPRVAWAGRRAMNLLGFAAHELSRSIVQTGRECVRWGLRRCIRMEVLSHSVLGGLGGSGDDAIVYPGTRRVQVTACLALPAHRLLFPLELCFRVVSPDGREVHRLLRRVTAAPLGQAIVTFLLDAEHGLCGRPGRWTIEATLGVGGRSLGLDVVEVVSRSTLVRDLVVVESELIEACGGGARATDDVYADAEFVVPRFRVRPRRFAPAAYAGMTARVELAQPGAPVGAEAHSIPLDVGGGEAVFGAVKKRIAGEAIARKSGRWEFRLTVEGRELARLPFKVTTMEEAARAVTLERLDLIGVGPDGACSVLPADPTRPCVANLHSITSLAPVITLRTTLPPGRIRHELVVGVLVNGEPIGRAAAAVVMSSATERVAPGRLPVERFARAKRPQECRFVVFVGDRCLATQVVVLSPERAPCADAQGRIVRSWSDAEVDFDAEAANLLEVARRGGGR